MQSSEEPKSSCAMAGWGWVDGEEVGSPQLHTQGPGTWKGRKGILSSSFDIPCRHTHLKIFPFLPYCSPECIISLWASLASKATADLGLSDVHQGWKKPPTKSSPKHRSFDQPEGLQRFYTCQTNLELTDMKTQRHPQCSFHFLCRASKAGARKEDTMHLQIPVWLEQ